MYLMRDKLALAALFMHRRQSLNVWGGVRLTQLWFLPMIVVYVNSEAIYYSEIFWLNKSSLKSYSSINVLTSPSHCSQTHPKLSLLGVYPLAHQPSWSNSPHVTWRRVWGHRLIGKQIMVPTDGTSPQSGRAAFSAHRILNKSSAASPGNRLHIITLQHLHSSQREPHVEELSSSPPLLASRNPPSGSHQKSQTSAVWNRIEMSVSGVGNTQ